ncbi:MAG: RidA family protein [Gammaproteobacteria bacterium]|jgi:enamine deaminase RidA (YjgF/YER057c/UK114 family)
MKIIQPDGWPRPKGYSNGIVAEGKMLFISGQIGWDENEQFQSDDFVAQIRQTLENTVAVLKAADSKPEHVVRMTWYITSRADYLANLDAIGQVYREIMGKTFPVMAMVEVSALMEARAKVEIETTAVIPHD